jgi:hypothetical protein
MSFEFDESSEIDRMIKTLISAKVWESIIDVCVGCSVIQIGFSNNAVKL